MRYITLDTNKKIIAIRTGTTMVEGEIESDIGELGQIMQPDGTFVDDPTPQPETQPTIEQRLDSLQNTVDLLLLKQEGII